MGNVFVSENIDIDVYPSIDQAHLAHNGAQLTIGDLHGNSVKLLYFLVRHGVLEMSPKDYDDVVQIYKTPARRLTGQHLARFNQIVANATINEAAKTSKLCLIGDEMCDRGNNDYYTIKLLQKLKDNDVAFDILISNHGGGLLQKYENGQPFNNFSFRPTTSAENLQILIDKNLVTRDEIDQHIQDCYLPSLKAINYTLNETSDRITIYSHAPIGIEMIEHTAKMLKIPFEGDNAVSIARTIDAINQKFSEYVKNNKVYRDLIKTRTYHKYASDKKTQTIAKTPIEINQDDLKAQEECPFDYLIWNRNYTNLNRPAWADFVHGHDSKELTQDNIFNLDNKLGKDPNSHRGVYDILYSQNNELKAELKLPEQEVPQDIDFDVIPPSPYAQEDQGLKEQLNVLAELEEEVGEIEPDEEENDFFLLDKMETESLIEEGKRLQQWNMNPQVAQQIENLMGRIDIALKQLIETINVSPNDTVSHEELNQLSQCAIPLLSKLAQFYDKEVEYDYVTQRYREEDDDDRKKQQYEMLKNQYETCRDISAYCTKTKSVDKKSEVAKIMRLALAGDDVFAQAIKQNPQLVNKLTEHTGYINSAIGRAPSISVGYKLLKKIFMRHKIPLAYLDQTAVQKNLLLNAANHDFTDMKAIPLKDALTKDERGRTVLHYLMENANDVNGIEAIANILSQSIGRYQNQDLAIRDDNDQTPLELLLANPHAKQIIDAINQKEIKGYGGGIYKINHFFETDKQTVKDQLENLSPTKGPGTERKTWWG